MENKKKFLTRAVHAGNKVDQETGAVIPPLHLTSTFEQESVGVNKGFDYSRAGNPTTKRYEENIASLEDADFAIAFSSGMAAITSLFQMLKNGDHVVIGRNTYGGTYRMTTQVLESHGFQFDFVDTRNIEEVESAIKPNTKIVFVETPTNPLLELCDIKEISKVCKKHRIYLAVDNTFMSPYGQSPLQLGADVIMHSATKYIGGHSDLISGVLITSDEVLAEKLYFIQKSGGAVPSPFDCWLLLRSTKTLGLRVQHQSDSAFELAKKLESHDEVKSIIYPGLESHEQHDLATKQQLNPDGQPIYGSMISIIVSSIEKRDSFLKKIKLFTLAESLGGVESLISVPYDMTHVSIPSDVKKAMGLPRTLIRLSVGVENIEDLYSDLLQALED
ncbi:PLP-dependent aspartate aminotransferase family protein [Candidatus Marinimicrobia bacterium]|jgi:cystathionine beta-lyase/cystathionine gamma-synthase|nr:PLP-dependent aspartate aminotransferase family protein [Candidatus Neomarinimicrobiota bacterium]|tara:strand:+ start:1060 stop:2226 length:1167 start_codon:yes stop_codon:yes gene_type:complete